MIKLNDILQLDNLNNVKVRFNLMFADNWNPIDDFKSGNTQAMLNGQYWNYKKQKSFKDGQVTIGLIPLNKKDNLWLLFHIGQITKDLNIYNGVGYEYVDVEKYRKFVGRVIVRFKNKCQTMVRNASSVLNECEVAEILPEIFDKDKFPGYDNVNISFNELSRVINNDGWKTALQNQKGVYLLTDSSNGKMYVGSAYGENMILGRWATYLKNGHGGNIKLKELGLEHISTNFHFSILDIFKSTTSDNTILDREKYWKTVLKTREFGYNDN